MLTSLLLAQQTATPANDAFDWAALLVGLLALAGALFGAIWATRDAVKSRREQYRHELARQYGEALATAIAWAEIPYRVARRTSDDADVLQAQAARIHELQERIVYHQQWLRVESPAIAERYDRLVAAVKRIAGPNIQAAWARPALSSAEQMNLGPLYRCDLTQECNEFVAAVRRELNLERTR